MSLFAEIEIARNNLRGVAKQIPLELSEALSVLTGGEVKLIPLNRQLTGSFKFLGPYNLLCQIPEDERRFGVIAASAGNHGQGVALAAELLNMSAKIVVPLGASLSKVGAIESLGARIIYSGEDYFEAEKKALEIQETEGLIFVPAFNHPKIIAGAGTIGLDIMEDWPDVDVIIAGIGGGGLISGIATAVKNINPSVRIIGVEPIGAAKITESLRANRLITLNRVNTFADGLAVRRAGELNLEIIKDKVDEIVTVDDDEISEAILFLMEREKTIAEGAGAVSVAALLSKKVDILGDKVVSVVSGGNIDVRLLDNIIKRGLLRTGRALIFSTLLPDKPGSLKDLLEILSEMRANVEEIQHDRIGPDARISESKVQIEITTRNHDHVNEILDRLKNKYEILTLLP